MNNPDKVSVTVTITAPLEEWKALREQLGGWDAKWPGYDFQKVIGDVVTQIESSALSTIEKE